VITLEDYLAVRDWRSIPPVFGEHGEYRWVRLGRSLWPPIFDQLTPPQEPFKILSLGLLDDLNNMEPEAFNPDGSTKKAEESLTPLTDSFRNLYINGGTMILDRVFEWSLIEPQASFLEPSYFLGDAEQSTQFWAAITQLEPYLYLVGDDHSAFIAREQSVFDQFMACPAVVNLGKESREIEAKIRLRNWQYWTANLSQEKCAVAGCSDMSVMRATKCFVHRFLTDANGEYFRASFRL
jgi:hypothetical protein